MGYRCSDGMCGALDCSRCYPFQVEEEDDYDDGNVDEEIDARRDAMLCADDFEPETDQFIERAGVQF